MRRIAPLLALSFAAAAAGCDSAASSPADPADEVRRELLAPGLAQVHNVHVVTSPRDAAFLAAVAEDSPRRFGGLRVFRVGEGGARAELRFAAGEAPAGPVIAGVRWVDVAGFARPLLEVYDETHSGEGSLSLYEPEGAGLRLLLRAPAVDSHAEGGAGLPFGAYGAVFRGEDGSHALDAAYRDVEADGVIDVELTGRVEYLGSGASDVVGTEPCRKVFGWSAERRVFTERRALRVGCGPFDVF